MSIFPQSHEEIPISDLRSSDEETSNQAYQQILKMGSSVVPMLIPILANESEPVEFRSRIAKLLGEIRDPAALQALIDNALSIGTKLDSGLGLFSALGGLGSNAKPAPRPIKANFIAALGHFKETQAVTALTSFLHEGDFDSQVFALAALRDMRTPEAVRAMISIVDYPARLDIQANPDLFKSPLFSNYSNVSQLAFALRKLGAAAAPATDLIIEALRKPISGKIHLIEIAGNLGGEQAGDVLFELLNDPDQDIRFEAIKALAKLRDRRAIPSLITYLSNSDPKLRGYAITSLGNFKDDAVVDALSPLLSDTETAHVSSYGNHDVTSVGKFAMDTLKKMDTVRALAAVSDWEKNNKNTLQ